MLKKNDFYKDSFVEKDKGYVASLIDSISADFRYDMEFSQKLDYNYSYRIAVEVDVEDEKNNSNIYHFTEDLVANDLHMNSSSLSINKNVTIKYGTYSIYRLILNSIKKL